MSTGKFFINSFIVTGLVVCALAVISNFGILNGLVTIPTADSTGQYFHVSAQGSALAKPDTATVNVSVVTKGDTVTETQADLNKLNNSVIEALRGLDIKDDKIKTINYSLNPSYRYDSEAGESIPTGYNAESTIKVELSDFAKLNDLLDTATKAGANRVSNVQFIVDERDEYVAEARQEALEKAKEQAKTIASESGIKLGKLVNVDVSENGNYSQPVRLERLSLAQDSSAPGSEVLPGSSEINVTVNLYYELN